MVGFNLDDYNKVFEQLTFNKNNIFSLINSNKLWAHLNSNQTHLDYSLLTDVSKFQSYISYLLNSNEDFQKELILNAIISNKFDLLRDIPLSKKLLVSKLSKIYSNKPFAGIAIKSTKTNTPSNDSKKTLNELLFCKDDYPVNISSEIDLLDKTQNSILTSYYYDLFKSALNQINSNFEDYAITFLKTNIRFDDFDVNYSNKISYLDYYNALKQISLIKENPVIFDNYALSSDGFIYLINNKFSTNTPTIFFNEHSILTQKHLNNCDVSSYLKSLFDNISDLSFNKINEDFLDNHPVLKKYLSSNITSINEPIDFNFNFCYRSNNFSNFNSKLDSNFLKKTISYCHLNYTDLHSDLTNVQSSYLSFIYNKLFNLNNPFVFNIGYTSNNNKFNFLFKLINNKPSIATDKVFEINLSSTDLTHILDIHKDLLIPYNSDTHNKENSSKVLDYNSYIEVNYPNLYEKLSSDKSVMHRLKYDKATKLLLYDYFNSDLNSENLHLTLENFNFPLDDDDFKDSIIKHTIYLTTCLRNSKDFETYIKSLSHLGFYLDSKINPGSFPKSKSDINKRLLNDVDLDKISFLISCTYRDANNKQHSGETYDFPLLSQKSILEGLTNLERFNGNISLLNEFYDLPSNNLLSYFKKPKKIINFNDFDDNDDIKKHLDYAKIILDGFIHNLSNSIFNNGLFKKDISYNGLKKLFNLPSKSLTLTKRAYKHLNLDDVLKSLYFVDTYNFTYVPDNSNSKTSDLLVLDSAKNHLKYFKENLGGYLETLSGLVSIKKIFFDNKPYYSLLELKKSDTLGSYISHKIVDSNTYNDFYNLSFENFKRINGEYMFDLNSDSLILFQIPQKINSVIYNKLII